jgi:two-component system response regulator AtoC
MATAELLPSTNNETSSPSGLEGAQIFLIDQPSVLEHLRSLLVGEACRISGVSKGEDAITKLKNSRRPDAILIDTHLPGQGGLSTLLAIREIYPSVPCVMLSCSYDPRLIVEAMRLGAVDVILKPFHRKDVVETLRRCVTIVDCSDENQAREIPLSDNTSFVFASERMRMISSQCSTIARVDIPVLILGESGTGKEVLAQFIHKMSPAAHRTFLKVNCAAMPADLLESELFGYEQGAFTGAVKAKPGKFELCNNGTILLDEIGEMPPTLQAKLLHVLQDGSFSRLGGRTTIKVNVRVIAATNIDMKVAIAERRFREDLFYRLNGISLHLPALRERKDEIPVLVRHFVRKLSDRYAQKSLTISDELLRACMGYSWLGNLRELENFVKRLLVLGDERLMIAELRGDRKLPGPASSSGQPEPVMSLKKLVRRVKADAEAEAISAALDRNNWSRRQAAAELKISYKALLYKMRDYGLSAPQSMRAV